MVKEGTQTNYVEGLNNLEYWHIKKTKDKVTRDGIDWWWWLEHKVTGEFDGMYMNPSPTNHDEWAEEKENKKFS